MQVTCKPVCAHTDAHTLTLKGWARALVFFLGRKGRMLDPERLVLGFREGALWPCR